MEKAASKYKRFWRYRLLRAAVPLIVLCAAMQGYTRQMLTATTARMPDAAAMSALEVHADAAYLFTATESSFTLDIPRLAPSHVQVAFEPLTEETGIRLLSSKRMEFIDDDGTTGTRLTFVLSFARAGTITPPPLTVTVGRHNYTVPFAAVRIYENPATLQPELFVTFSTPVQYSDTGALLLVSGTTLEFTVHVRYATHIENISWELPKDAIFRELSRTEAGTGASIGERFSPHSTALASFSWTPLFAAECALPKITALATAYSGKHVQLSTACYEFTVQASSTTMQTAQNESTVFAEAFAAPATEAPSPATETVAEPIDCAYLAELRSKERHSLPKSTAWQKRIAYEHAHGLPDGANEAQKPLADAAFAFFMLSLSTLALLVAKRRYRKAVITAIPVAACLVLYLHFVLALAAQHAIFADTSIRAIPEMSASLRAEKTGSRVRILEKAGDWVYISLSNTKNAATTGWVQESALYPIR